MEKSGSAFTKSIDRYSTAVSLVHAECNSWMKLDWEHRVDMNFLINPVGEVFSNKSSKIKPAIVPGSG